MVLPQHSIERRTFMGTTILSFSDRVVIETLHNEKRSLQYIANYLGFSTTTIFNELHRLNSEYQAELAQTDFEQKVSQRGRSLRSLKTLNTWSRKRFKSRSGPLNKLPMLIHHMNAVVMRTVTEFCDGLFPRDKPLKN